MSGRAQELKNRSDAIQTVSLDHITKASVPLHQQAFREPLVQYETRWHPQKETRWPQRGEGGWREMNAQRFIGSQLCLYCPSLILSLTHSSPIGLGDSWMLRLPHANIPPINPALITTETNPSQQLCCCWTPARGGRLVSEVGVRQVGGAASEVTRHGEHKIRLISPVETGGLLFGVLVAHHIQSKDGISSSPSECWLGSLMFDMNAWFYKQARERQSMRCFICQKASSEKAKILCLGSICFQFV